MHVSWRAGLVAANGANFLDIAIRYIKAMLTMHNKCIIVHHVSMKNDLFISIKFEEHVDNVIFLVNIQYRIFSVLEIWVRVPFNILIIKAVRCHRLTLPAGQIFRGPERTLSST